MMNMSSAIVQYMAENNEKFTDGQEYMTHTFWNTGRAIETVSMSEATIHHLYFW